MKKSIKPKVFISYAWGDAAYQKQVLDFASRLVSDGIDVIIDKWDLREGNEMNAFMQQCVTNPTVTNVLMLLDPVYASKADNLCGGVGTETQIISPKVYNEVAQSKFIPVVMKRDERGNICKPVYLGSRLHFDLSVPESFEETYKRLVKRLYGKELYPKPQKGGKPKWVDEPIDKETAEDYHSTAIEVDTYFSENAEVNGSTLVHFKGRMSTNVVIPEGITVIGARAFGFDPGLKGISIPSTVKQIEEYAFVNCPNLCSINVAPDNPAYRSENNCCIEKDSNKLVFGCCESVIPYGVTIIGEYAFSGCKNLLKVRIPSSVLSIEEAAFFHCDNLETLEFEDGVKEIKPLAFCGCFKLREIFIPRSITRIASGAFNKCSGVETICVAGNNPVYYSDGNCCLETSTSSLVIGCKNSVIPNGTSAIGASAFIGCTDLKEISLPNSVKIIGESAFFQCNKLKSVIIPDGTELICSSAFAECANLNSISLSESVRGIETGAFRGCPRLKSIKVSQNNPVYCAEDNCCINAQENMIVFGCRCSVIPDRIIEIAEYAFSGCSLLTDICLPNSLVKIGENAFESCGFEAITIPRSVRYIGGFAFYDCNDLRRIVLPNSVLYIGEDAFAGCYYDEEFRREIFSEEKKKPAKWHKDWTDDISDIHWKSEWNYDEDGIPMIAQ